MYLLISIINYNDHYSIFNKMAMGGHHTQLALCDPANNVIIDIFYL